MIVQQGTTAVRRLADAEPGSMTGFCLVRRGMLHSECESIDCVSLAPGDSLVHNSRDFTEAAFYVVAGKGLVRIRDGGFRLTEGSLLLAGAGSEVEITAEAPGIRVIVIRVLPKEISGLLPPRRPELRPSRRPHAISHSEPA